MTYHSVEYSKQDANAIRALAMDAVEKAKSGHPGMPMGMADVASVLFRGFLKFDAADPHWPDRDRFVLSAGHGSMLLYALGYLVGYPGLDIEDLKQFRQLGSKTAGHPEYGHAPGVETTTGPLGQGLATAVGMAIAERLQAARFGDELVDHFTYVLAGDGCLMEGVSHEAIDLAGHLRLGKLIVLWDDNSISIDGPTSSRDLDRPGGAVQGQRLACATNFRPRLQADRRGADAGEERSAPVDDRLPHDDRLWRSRQGGQGKRAWRAAGVGADRRRARETWLAFSAFRSPRADPGRLAQGRRARRALARGLAATARQLRARRRVRAVPARRRRRRNRRAAPGLSGTARAGKAQGRDAQILRNDARRHQWRDRARPSAARPI